MVNDKPRRNSTATMTNKTNAVTSRLPIKTAATTNVGRRRRMNLGQCFSAIVWVLYLTVAVIIVPRLSDVSPVISSSALFGVEIKPRRCGGRQRQFHAVYKVYEVTDAHANQPSHSRAKCELT